MSQPFTNECDIGQYFRAWLLGIPEVAAYVEQRVVDTVPAECRKAFLWYSLEDEADSDSLCEGVDEFDYTLEIVGPEIELPQLRRLKSIIGKACRSYERGTPFGAPDFWVQSLEVMRVRDDYQPAMPMYFDGIAVTFMSIQITP